MRHSALLFRAHHRACALPVEDVVEAMRPLPVEEMVGAPAFVAGVAIIRGVATPVLDAGALLDARSLPRPGRLVLLRSDGRRVGLLVSSVAGVLTFEEEAFEPLPPLLRTADPDRIERLGRVDGALLHVLHRGRLVPDDLWARLETDEA